MNFLRSPAPGLLCVEMVAWKTRGATGHQPAMFCLCVRPSARLLAQAGEADMAIDEIERRQAGPSAVSVHMLRLDPIWDPIRDHPRFQALLAKTGDVKLP